MRQIFKKRDNIGSQIYKKFLSDLFKSKSQCFAGQELNLLPQEKFGITSTMLGRL